MYDSLLCTSRKTKAFVLLGSLQMILDTFVPFLLPMLLLVPFYCLLATLQAYFAPLVTSPKLGLGELIVSEVREL